ncbi:MAG: hypothetical protein ACK41C_08065 [Phenylobacterium sp.]|uniref:hypothetical protein n=1 Tax=Phenylobacterium sp. TaxID=1871053 RepID=UPI00391ADFB9
MLSALTRRWLRPRRASAPPAFEPELQAQVEAAFDAGFYLERNPDVAAAGADPLEHFLEHGWREGRDPSAAFPMADYLRLNPDVRQTGENPLLHYLTKGRAEGREVRPSLGFRHEILLRLEPLDDRLDILDTRRRAGPADPPARLAERLAGAGDLHLTVSHDDYTAHLGGLQLSLRREAAGLVALSFDHLHLFPATPYPTIRDGRPAELIGVLWNGEPVGYFAAADVARAFAAGPQAGRRSFALHSLLGHVVEDVLTILAAGGMHEGVFWLHDYAGLCAGFHLMRDDVADCGAPPPDSAACGICVYGPHRGRHMEAFRRLFESLSLTVVAPSRSALETWRGAVTLPHAGQRVLPHATLVRGRPAPAGTEGPLRVAYPGFPVAHKGWPVFEALAARFAEDSRYRFLHVGRANDRSGVEFHEADGAIAERLAELEVDVALVWPLCRETFGLIAYEAAAAGAAVVTHADTGNVADFVRTEGPGLILEDEAHLARVFETGEILALSRARREAKLYDLAFSALTADLLAETLKPQAAAIS